MNHNEEIFEKLKNTWDLTGTPLVSKEVILQQLEARISEMIVRQPEQFFQLMYRLDISEQKVQQALFDPENGIRQIALLIYERQLQKIHLRASGKTTKSDDPDLEW